MIVDGCMLVKRRIKPQGDQPGYVMTKEATIHYSNVMLVDPKTGYVNTT
jgi:large subunit ribosomal protein L24